MIEKCKDLLQDMKTRLQELISRYNDSGNGSDMVMFDYDMHGGHDVEEKECIYRWYNG